MKRGLREAQESLIAPDLGIHYAYHGSNCLSLIWGHIEKEPYTSWRLSLEILSQTLGIHEWSNSHSIPWPTSVNFFPPHSHCFQPYTLENFRQDLILRGRWCYRKRKIKYVIDEHNQANSINLRLTWHDFFQVFCPTRALIYMFSIVLSSFYICVYMYISTYNLLLLPIFLISIWYNPLIM